MSKLITTFKNNKNIFKTLFFKVTKGEVTKIFQTANQKTTFPIRETCSSMIYKPKKRRP